ncbi:helix-turn-helix transcriptional regulator [Pseudomonas sp.]|uniref:helix-turn-helix domain-containing protein n=1 Tax=Pseudomonas sp. TaxID=306 RepID=UPI002ED7EDA0
MAMRKDNDLYEINCQEVGKRLRMARLACKLSQKDVADHLKHENATQISLWESGDRLPPLTELISVCQLYMVPTDFIFGTIDDPIADPVENRMALGVKAVTETIESQFMKFASALGNSVAVTLDSRDHDRKEAKAMAEMAAEAETRFHRLLELNPDFETECRGGASLVSSIQGMVKLGKRARERIESEEKRLGFIDRELSFKDKTNAHQQFLIPLLAE